MINLENYRSSPYNKKNINGDTLYSEIAPNS